jgi:hypothetical protein
MTKEEFELKWTGISAAADSAEKLACVYARFGGYGEIQVEIPRRALLEMRRDVLGAGGGMRAVFI